MTILLPYQQECVQEIEDFHGRALLALFMGAGKTPISLDYLQRHPEITTVVAVVPSSLKWQWEREAATHIGVRANVISTRKVNTAAMNLNARLWIISYAVIHNWLDFFMEKCKPQMVIIDECHFLLDTRTLRTRSVRALCKNVPHILALSGTPLVNRPIELWPTLNILRPDVWSNRSVYCNRHCSPKLTYFGWTYQGASNLGELHTKMKRYVMVRRRIEDVLPQLPRVSRYIIPLDIDNRKEYAQAVRDFIGWLRTISPGKARRAAKAEKMVKIGYLLRMVAMAKMKGVFEWVDNFLIENDKLLLFGVHDKVLTALEDRYKKICVRVDGSTAGTKRQKAFDQFNQLPRTKLFLGNIDAAGVGWSCTATSDVALVETGWSPGKVDQAINRVRGLYRGVEGMPVRAWHLVAHQTVEEKLCEILQKKSITINKVLDGRRVVDNLDIFDLLMKEMENL